MSLGLPSDKSPLGPEAGEARDEEHRQFAWTLHDVFRLFQRSWNRRLRESGLGISPAQSRVLTEIHKHGGQTQTAIAENVEMEKAPLGRILDRLDELGLIERRPDPNDRRVRLVFQTEKAECLDEPMWGTASGLFECALKDFSAEDMQLLISLLDRLKENLIEAEGGLVANEHSTDK